ncbi:MAG: biotin--[acetyl-CoA-carboxylase] ligase [Spirochaetaceae bacterium]|nr:biotin--[acetyl-CoA-carboxylase] ligase [Spirochaetaceae bacterium]
MKPAGLENPFGGEFLYFDSCVSTMDEARRLSAGASHGTVVMAGLQSGGRGRFPSRSWVASAGKNLTFTLILRYSGFSSVPVALTLRCGIAVARAIEALEPLLSPLVAVKWPNDVMLGDKKCAGLLAEYDGSVVLLGIGVNVAEDFGGAGRTDAPLNAVSIAGALAALDEAAGADCKDAPHSIQRLLEKVLAELFVTLSPDFDCLWRAELEKRLYMKGRSVRFVTGAAAAPRTVSGMLAGIGAGGELLVIPAGKHEVEAFAAGEISLNRAAF